MTFYLPWLEDLGDFPPVEEALKDPNGLLAAGGNLEPTTLLHAYRKGIFPWFSEGQPILWWSPHPRCVVFPDKAHTSRSLRKHIRKIQPRLTFNQAFSQVIHHCARLDEGDDGVWILPEMEEAYCRLNELGIAHSVEVWREGTLIGGLYGLAIGSCFFGESMFSLETNASKIAFSALNLQLQKWGYAIIDCQVENPHLISLGAETINRREFLSILNLNIDKKPVAHCWQFDDIFGLAAS